jgi:hypothetical protein
MAWQDIIDFVVNVECAWLLCMRPWQPHACVFTVCMQMDRCLEGLFDTWGIFGTTFNNNLTLVRGLLCMPACHCQSRKIRE